jgi:endoglucanase
MKKFIIPIVSIFLLVAGIRLEGQSCKPNYLNAVGNKLYDANGKEVRLTGVNWFGFETSMLYPHGLWSRDLKSVLKQIKDLGFNCLRIPWCNKMLDPSVTIRINSYGTDPYTGVSPMNAEESTKTKPIEILDIIVDWCQKNNMKIILDNHSRKPDAYMEELLWYRSDFSEEKWIADWVFLADRYKNYDAVVGMDLNNEPHGKYNGGATWGNSNPATDWNKAAERCGNAILKVNPNVLIIVEGVELYNSTTYWWGGNLMGAKDFPIQLSNPQKLVYSPHEYGPTVYPQDWFSAPDFPNNMPAIWEKFFGYIITQNIAPLLVGEFGIRDRGGKDEIWFDAFLKFMGTKYSWTFWCLNPNSGDTGGLLDDQWINVVSWKVDKLRPYLAPPIPNCNGGSTTVPVTGVTVSPTTLNLTVGQTATLTATVSPANATNKNVTWSSSNTSVATVSSTGVVTAVAAGSATITVTTVDGAKTATCAVTVTGSTTVPVTGVTVSPTTLSLTVGQTATLTATVSPANATNKNVTWSSSNTSVATVSSTGVVTAVAAGSATITVTTVDGAKTATCAVTVTAGGTTTPCSNPIAITIPFSKDGAGEFCYVSSQQPAYVNSWNMDKVEINGVDYTNKWSNTMPAAIGGKWYIYYKGSFPWSHFEAPAAKSSASAATANIEIYPNPFNDQINIRLNGQKVVKIELYNAVGQLLAIIGADKLQNDLVTIPVSQEGKLFLIKITSQQSVISHFVLKH